jgi:antitoxin (DNA-binding transcriptional repressor) of toxin-antitoxin stability system
VRRAERIQERLSELAVARQRNRLGTAGYVSTSFPSTTVVFERAAEPFFRLHCVDLRLPSPWARIAAHERASNWTMVADYGRPGSMDTMPISKFKATCLAALERVRRTGRPLRVTRFGKPIADVVPAAPEKPACEWLGSLRGSLEISGDIVGPSSDFVKWEALE